MNTENSLYNAPAAKCPILQSDKQSDSSVQSSNLLDPIVWSESSPPEGDELIVGAFYYLTSKVADISKDANPGTSWYYGGSSSWTQINGQIKLLLNH